MVHDRGLAPDIFDGILGGASHFRSSLLDDVLDVGYRLGTLACTACAASVAGSLSRHDPESVLLRAEPSVTKSAERDAVRFNESAVDSRPPRSR